jgi:hypothetical protein
VTAPTQAEKIKALQAITAPVQMSDADFRARILLYGDPGAGKTDLAGKIANCLGDNICLVYSDSNWTTLLKYPEIVPRLSKIPFGGLSTVSTILDGRDLGIEPYASYNVLIWDTASTGVKIGISNLVANRKFPKDQYAPDLPGRPHYLLIELGMGELLTRILKSDLHVIFTAHLRYPSEQDIKQGKISLRPAFPEATYRAVAQHCNMVGYMYSETANGQYKIDLRGTERVTAKCQIPNIEQKTYNTNQIVPSLDEWIKKS